jgi:hypothetical protein
MVLRSGTRLLLVLLAMAVAFATAQTRGQGVKTQADQAQGAASLPDAPGKQSPDLSEDTTQDGHLKAEKQIKEEEKQRLFGVVENFNTSYRSDAVSLTASEKIRLAIRAAIDPANIAAASLVAGYGEATDSDSGFPWGPSGLGERVGAKYLDIFDGTILGNGVFPALFRQDPRYFRMGHGSKRRRILYAMATTVICKHDKTGKWEPNYSNVLGNISSGALSNLYYPAEDSGVGLTISNGLIVTAEGTGGAIFQEFWPDLSRKLFHRDPTHGLDAIAASGAATGKQVSNPQQ